MAKEDRRPGWTGRESASNKGVACEERDSKNGKEWWRSPPRSFVSGEHGGGLLYPQYDPRRSSAEKTQGVYAHELGYSYNKASAGVSQHDKNLVN